MLYPPLRGISYLRRAELQKDNQTDKMKADFLYASNVEEQHSYIETADKGYKVLLLDSPDNRSFNTKLEGDKKRLLSQE